MENSTPLRLRHFFLTWISCGIILLAFAAATISLTTVFGRVQLPYQVLVSYQMSKLPSLAVDTIFVGDSSLGNSIDAVAWQRFSGERAVNLALTGAYSYEGVRWMIVNALKSASPRKIVIMNTADMMTRQPINPLLEESVRNPGASFNLTRWWQLNMNFEQLAAAWKFLKTLGNREDASAEVLITNDYIKQGPTLSSDVRPPHLTTARILEQKITILRQIVEVCRERAIQCFYAHGPLLASGCTENDHYFDRVNAIIRQTGLLLINERPVCIPPGKIGDTIDHVAPAYKSEFTAEYWNLIQKAAYR